MAGAGVVKYKKWAFDSGISGNPRFEKIVEDK